MHCNKRVVALAGLCAILLAVMPLRAGDPPAAGTPAPDFSLKSQDGSTVSLKDFRGKWVVLYFYPKDMTSGCTIEAKAFQRDLAKYTEKGAVILGVSVDNADSHKEFCTKESLTFKLLADTEKDVSGKYGSLMEYQGNQYSARNTFVIDPKGNIARVFLKVKPTPHSEEVLAALDELRAGAAK